jgi:hypothetical protein
MMFVPHRKYIYAPLLSVTGITLPFSAGNWLYKITVSVIGGIVKQTRNKQTAMASSWEQ